MEQWKIIEGTNNRYEISNQEILNVMDNYLIQNQIKQVMLKYEFL